MNEIVFIGGLNLGNNPRGGEEAKNQKLYFYLKELDKTVFIIDTHNWRNRLFKIFLGLIRHVLLKKERKIIISVSDESAYKLIRFLNIFDSFKRNDGYYFVIGGDFTNLLNHNRDRIKLYNSLKGIYPESKKMLHECKNLGLSQAYQIPNFRKIPIIFPKKNISHDGITRFIYLSRLTPEKGLDIAIDACYSLNKQMLESNFEVHFYGFFDEKADDYKNNFMDKLKDLPNVAYLGFLDVNTTLGFKKLSEYDMLIFPTYWPHEGYPGTLTDTLSAGIPAIASDWNYNTEIIEDGYNGLIIKPKCVESLVDKMRKIISNPHQLPEMSKNAYESSKSYDISDLLSKTILK